MSFITESRKAYKQVQEAEDHEISMARGELEAIADKATQLASMLQGKSDEGNPLEAWVQSKITKAKDYINSVSDYMMYDPSINETYDLEETTFEKIYQMQQDGKSSEDIAKELKLKPDLVKKVLGESKTISEGLSDAQIAQLKKEYEPLKGKTITTSQYQQLKNILFKLQDGDLEKLQKQNIPFASTGAGSILRVRKSPVKITSVKVPGLEGMAEEQVKEGITGAVAGGVLGGMALGPIGAVAGAYLGHKVQKAANKKKESFKDNIVKKLVKPIQDFNKKKEEPKKEAVEIQEKPIDAKDLIKTIKDLRIDDLKVNDDKNFIHIVKEFDPTIDKLDDVKSEYMDIVKTLNQKGINYKPNASQDIEKDQEYIQINFSVKKEAVDNPYAIGMAAAMKATGDTPPLKKSTIVKAHKIADKVKKEEVDLDENISQVTTKKGVTRGDSTDLFYKGKHIGYYHKITKNDEGKIGNYFVYHDNEDDPEDFTQSDEVSSETQAKKVAYDSAKSNGLIEEVEITETHFSMGQHVIYKPKSMTPRKAQIIQVSEPQVGAYYKIKISPTLMTYAKPDELELDEACWTGYKQVGLKKKGKRMVPNCVPEETIKEQKRLYIESIVAVKNKAEKSGMPYSILKQVYDRGMAAWKGGHRPGTTQVQWALARVNSFVTKSSGTWGGADSDLAKKVKG